MAFMEPQYVLGSWVEVEDKYGETRYVPAEYAEDLEEGEHAVRLHPLKVGARLSASGYMDCTEWSIFDTEEAARDYIRDTYDVDPDTGDEMEEEEEEEEES
jgi:hypothetical protein